MCARKSGEMIVCVFPNSPFSSLKTGLSSEKIMATPLDRSSCARSSSFKTLSVFVGECFGKAQIDISADLARLERTNNRKPWRRGGAVLYVPR